MSIAVMTEVWKDAPVAGTELLMLLALADSCNDDRECWPSVRHLQHKVRVSEPQARKLLKSLERQGLIEIVTKGGKGTKGRESNLYKISPVTPIAHDTSTPIAHDTLNHHSESSLNTLASGEAGDDSKPKAKTPRQPNPMYDAIKDIWGYTAVMNGAMEKMLKGTATKPGWKEYNLETPIAANDLRRWAQWYRQTVLKGDDNLNMLEERIKINSSITQWQERNAPSEEIYATDDEGRSTGTSYTIGGADDPFKDEIIID
jgi:hypothetical protein